MTHQLLALAVMAAMAYPCNGDPKKPAAAEPRRKKPAKKKNEITKQTSSWDQIKSLLTCKQVEVAKIHDPSRRLNSPHATIYASIFTLRDAVHSSARVVHRADHSPDGSSLCQETRLLGKKSGGRGSSSSARSVSSLRSGAGGAPLAGRGMQLRRLSGCYECHAIVDPSRYPLPRTTICACSECGEVFPKIESLEHHRAVKHAVSELGPDDSSRNIVELIFKSSWLKKDNTICKIERILKVHNTHRTIQRFEDYRDAVKARAGGSAAKRDARCAADGNELLRFHCATLACSLGARGSSGLCGSGAACGVCNTIRHGFQGGGRSGGIWTTASSGQAHDSLGGGPATRRAMLVCRVIAGRVKRVSEEGPGEEGGAYDSVAASADVYSNVEELRVFSSRAILLCFVVVYKVLEG